ITQSADTRAVVSGGILSTAAPLGHLIAVSLRSFRLTSFLSCLLRRYLVPPLLTTRLQLFLFVHSDRDSRSRVKGGRVEHRAGVMPLARGDVVLGVPADKRCWLVQPVVLEFSPSELRDGHHPVAISIHSSITHGVAVVATDVIPASG